MSKHEEITFSWTVLRVSKYLLVVNIFLKAMAVAKLHFILAYTLIRRRFAAVENYTNGMLCCKFVDSTKFILQNLH